MSANSSIEWTDRTWNPTRGCSVISPGCVNCYAMKQGHRFSGPGKAYEGLTKLAKAGPQWTGVVRTVDAALLEPLSWRKPQRVFVNSMSDLFHEDVPDAFIDRVFAVMALAGRHTFQVLTKRPERMRRYFSDLFDVAPHDDRRTAVELALWEMHTDYTTNAISQWPLRNVWLGVSVEDQKHADLRIPLLLQTPAAVRFISAEPLLGPVNFRWAKWDDHAPSPRRAVQAYPPVERDGRIVAGSVNELDGLRMLDWVICGGESGPGARPFDLAWARSIVQQCQAASVACFVKQLGAKPTVTAAESKAITGFDSTLEYEWVGRDRDRTRLRLRHKKGGDPSEWPEDLRVREFPEVRA